MRIQGTVYTACVLELRPLRALPGHCLHHLRPGAPSTPCASRALSTPPASWGSVHSVRIQGTVYTTCVLGLRPLHAHPGHCLHCLCSGTPSTPCTSRALSTPPESWRLRPHCRHPGVLSTQCASWGSIHAAHAQGCHCTLRGPRQTASRPPFLSRSGDLGVRSGAGQISIKVKVSQSGELLASILSHF